MRFDPARTVLEEHTPKLNGTENCLLAALATPLVGW
jgi:hypothetical protein